MKPHLPLILLLLLQSIPLPAAETADGFRTFHDLRGRQIRATIIRTGPGSVWIRRDDGQTFQIDPANLSPQDRAFITEWERENQLQSASAITFSVRRFTEGGDTEKTATARRSTNRLGYQITLENRTTIPLNNLSIEYRIFIHRGSIGATGQNRPLERQTGFAEIRNLPPRNKTEFKTDTVELTSISLRPGSSFGSRDNPNSNQRKIRDDLAGIWLRISYNGKIISEFSSPSTLMRTEKWHPEDSWWLQNRESSSTNRSP